MDSIEEYKEPPVARACAQPSAPITSEFDRYIRPKIRGGISQGSTFQESVLQRLPLDVSDLNRLYLSIVKDHNSKCLQEPSKMQVSKKGSTSSP